MAAQPGPSLPVRLRLLVAVAVTVLVGAAQIRGGEWPGLRDPELLTLDARFRLRGPLEPSPAIVLVAIDEATVRAFGRWPPPRVEIAAVLRRLALAHARVAVLALSFTEPAQALPPELRRSIDAASRALDADHPDLKAELAALATRPDPDVVLATELHRLPTVLAWTVAAETLGPVATADRTRHLREEAFSIVLREDGGIATVADVASARPEVGEDVALVPPPVLTAAAGGLGHGWLLLDTDGLLRFDLPVLAVGGHVYPSLALEAVRLYADVPRDDTTVTLHRGVQLGPRIRVPTDRRMRLLLNALGRSDAFPTVSFIDVHAGRIDPTLLKDRIVVIGATASGTGDRFGTPFEDRAPGAIHVATAIDNILQGRALRRDGSVLGIDLLATAILASAGAAWAGRRSLLASAAVLLTVLAGWGAVAQAAFANAAIWLGVAAPWAAAGLAAFAVEATRQARDQARRRAVEQERRNLSRYFPPTVVERLAGTDRPRALDRTQEAAVMFIDVVGFSRLAETMEPAAAMAFLRELHTRVEGAVFAHGGVVADFMGDGAMTVFGVPEPTSTDACDALRAARALIADVERWSAERAAHGEPPVWISVGIHRGPVLMGDIGGSSQFQFTTIGDTVNVASRLEAMTRAHAARLILSGTALEAALRNDPEAATGLEPLPPVPIRGREGALAAWRLPLPEPR